MSVLHFLVPCGWTCVAENPHRVVAVPVDVNVPDMCLCWECCVTRARELARRRTVLVNIRTTRLASGVWQARHVQQGLTGEGTTKDTAVSALLRQLWRSD